MEQDRAPATLSVATQSPDGVITAEIFLDGKRVGQSPLFKPGIEPGMHHVEARAQGWKPAAKRVRLLPGKETRVILVLKP
jgi:hypothetical protein